MKFGKTIKIFLIEGEPNGRMYCELSNWSGKAFKIPRIKIKDCIDRKELNNTGIYLLFGKTDDGKDIIYIGEAENVLKRINQHLTQKDFWNETIIFISKDDNLNKAHVKYLENRLHEIANETKRYSIENSTIPTQSSISESDRAEMEEFIENIKLLVNSLGHKVFDDRREILDVKRDTVFIIKSVRGAEAQGKPTSEGFIVFKGSKAAAQIVNSLAPSMINFRNKLIDTNILINKNDYFEFTDDYIFKSSSTAAVIVMGRNANGLLEWKNKSGETLREYETKEKDAI